MKKVEIVLVMLAVAGLSLRIGKVEGGVLLSTVAFLLLALFYLLFALPYFSGIRVSRTFSNTAYLEKGAGTFQRLLTVIAGFVFFIALMGILFVLNYWPGAFFFWCMGMFFLVPVAALSLGKHLLQPAIPYKASAIRAGIFLLTGIALVAAQM